MKKSEYAIPDFAVIPAIIENLNVRVGEYHVGIGQIDSPLGEYLFAFPGIESDPAIPGTSIFHRWLADPSVLTSAISCSVYVARLAREAPMNLL